ncbi:MAG: tetratricopeptide repeat protein [Isosphaerales bacterium]
MAGPLYQLGNFAAAERLLRLAVERTRPDKPNRAVFLNTLASLLHETSRLAEAEPLYRRALAIDEASHGPDHPSVARDLNNLALLLQATNRLAEAEPLSRRMVEIFLQFSRETGHAHPHLIAAINNYGRLLAAMGYRPEQVRARLDEIGCPLGIRMDPSEQVSRLSIFTGAQTPHGSGGTTSTGIAPSSAEEHFQCGEECRVKEHWDQAIDHFNAAIRLDRDFADAYFNRGLAREAMRDCEGAFADFAKCVELEPFNITYRYQLDAAKRQ